MPARVLQDPPGARCPSWRWARRKRSTRPTATTAVYDITSGAVRNVHESSAAGVRTVVITFSNLNITDETAPGEHGAIVVQCSRFTLQVVIVTGTGGPHAGEVGFELRDGEGKSWCGRQASST